jgi:hypothetical protein
MNDRLRPDFEVTDEQARAESAVVSMEAWGLADFRGAPVDRVSVALHEALQAGFGRAATAGLSIADVREVWPEASFDDGRTGLVPPWAVLGDLLAVYLSTAKDTADGMVAGRLYTTDAIAGLGDRPISLERTGLDGWTAYFSDDR